MKVGRCALLFLAALLLPASSVLKAAETTGAPPVAVCGFRPSGLLRERTMLNFDRMDSGRFAPVEKTGCLREAEYAWPGDMEGRALLAFARLERATGRPSAHLAGLRAAWHARLNSQGYFGKPLDPQAIDEQQLSGHGWVLRALCELYDWKREPAVLEEIRAIVKGLALPTRGAHAVYPIEPKDRVKEKGSYSGEHVQQIGRWVLSTDIGCDLIFMDGLMQAAALLGDADTDALCEEILARNLQIDLAGIQAQTHATLTGVRGMLRGAAYKHRPALVAEAEKRFRLYLTEGMTENNENWNWFGRPKHTEPCAVVDSFIAAHELWRLGGNAEYLAWAHRIVYNGFFQEQVANGGFGCSTVSGADSNCFVGISIPEAWWCCTMRAAEGFAELSARALYSDGNCIFVAGLSSGMLDLPLKGGRLAGAATGGYPFEGRWALEVQTAPQGQVAWNFFTPPWAAGPAVTLNGKPVDARTAGGFTTAALTLKEGDRLEYTFVQRVYTRPTVNRHSTPGSVTVCHGPLILALPPGAPRILRLPPVPSWRWDEVGRCASAPGFEGVLTPLGDRFLRAEPEGYARQMLFEAAGISEERPFQE
jgi:uncharacterized protein